MNKLPPMILGVAGHPASGKDMVATYLVDHYGFAHFSTGDFIRKHVRENNLGEPTRPLLHKVANFLREKNGPDYLVREGLKEKAEHLVISGFRNIADVGTIKTAGGKVIAINVPIHTRYEWAMSRSRVGDRITFEEFKEQQKKEEDSDNPSGAHVNSIIEVADHMIENNGTVEELYEKIDDLLVKIGGEGSHEVSKSA